MKTWIWPKLILPKVRRFMDNLFQSRMKTVSGELVKINYSTSVLKSILDLIQSAILLVALNTSTQIPQKQTILSTMQYQTLVRIELSATQLMMPRLLKESLIINGLGKRRRSQHQYHIQVLNVDWMLIWIHPLLTWMPLRKKKVYGTFFN